MIVQQHPEFYQWRVPTWGDILWPLLLGWIALSSVPLLAGEIDGFTEPYRSIRVATSETGIIAELKVREGDAVRQGQLLATLDNDVQRALVSIAQKHAELRGRLASAQAELALRQNRQAKIEELWAKGHARREEVDRGRADVAIAAAQVLAAEEELAVRQLEYEKITVDLRRRSVYAPLDGVVATLHKDSGEFVAPTDPFLLDLVQLDRLLGVFSVPAQQAEPLRVGATLPVQVGEAALPVDGIIESVSPVTDAESGTVRVKVGLDNTHSQYRSGQRCTLRLPDEPSPASGRPAAASRSRTNPPAPAASGSPQAVSYLTN